MKRILKAGFGTALAWSLLTGAAAAQLEAARDAPVAMGHHHVNTADLEASRRFWVGQLGGVSVELGPLEMVRFPNLLVALTPKTPSEGSFGSTVNHIGLQVPDVEALVERLAAAGVPIRTLEHVPPAAGPIFDLAEQDTRIAFVESPEGVRVELFENREQERPIENHHIHFYTVDPLATRDWYAQHFGAKPRLRGSFESADLGGVNLTFSAGDTVGTQGRALDHIGFEVKDLEGLVRILERNGVEFSRPYTRVEALDLSFAFFTDPWGTYVELTEGLVDL